MMVNTSSGVSFKNGHGTMSRTRNNWSLKFSDSSLVKPHFDCKTQSLAM